MSTWINRGLALALLLGACVPAGSGFSTPRTAPVLDGQIQVGVPRGYCIDRRAGREAEDTAVIVMGRCRTDVDAAPAVLTTAIGPAASGRVLGGGGAALADYFTSDAGRAALSRNGRADAVTILQAKMVGPAFVLRIADRTAGPSWRGVASVAGRLVTVTVIFPNGVEAEGADTNGEALLIEALGLTQQANGGAD